jgi:hypothetical protein
VDPSLRMKKKKKLLKLNGKKNLLKLNNKRRENKSVEAQQKKYEKKNC